MHHSDFMSHALALAAKGQNTVSPNPMVGCVIVRNQQIVGEGYHQYAGGPHAEVMALNQAGSAAKGATAYITLEPCCHHGKTPPCTQSLIDAGIKNIYAACEDPNPLVAGNGFRALRSAGIALEIGLFADEARQLNERFFHYMRTNMPYVVAKWAMSLDGKTVTNHADNKRISGRETQDHSHHLRQECDAILVGANTIIHDNPQLTVRSATRINKQPVRIILTGKTKLPEHAHVFNDENKTILITTELNQHLYAEFRKDNTETILVNANQDHQISLQALLKELGKHGITSLFVEGGMSVHQNFLAENLVNKLHVYLSPVIIGSHKHKHYYRDVQCNKLGEDYHLYIHQMEHQNV